MGPSSTSPATAATSSATSPRASAGRPTSATSPAPSTRPCASCRWTGCELSSALPADHFDVVFMSNYLEHLPSSDAVVRQLDRGARRSSSRAAGSSCSSRTSGSSAAPTGTSSTTRSPLTDRSLAEAAEVAGFQVERMIPRFLPYTHQEPAAAAPALVRAYLRFPPAWRLMGKQALMVARRTGRPVAVNRRVLLPGARRRRRSRSSRCCWSRRAPTSRPRSAGSSPSTPAGSCCPIAVVDRPAGIRSVAMGDRS